MQLNEQHNKQKHKKRSCFDQSPYEKNISAQKAVINKRFHFTVGLTTAISNIMFRGTGIINLLLRAFWFEINWDKHRLEQLTFNPCRPKHCKTFCQNKININFYFIDLHGLHEIFLRYHKEIFTPRLGLGQ